MRVTVAAPQCRHHERKRLRCAPSSNPTRRDGNDPVHVGDRAALLFPALLGFASGCRRLKLVGQDGRSRGSPNSDL